MTPKLGVRETGSRPQVLSVYVDTPQVLVINSIAYHVTPSKPATVQTNWLGQLTVTALASALASPVLTISGTIFGSATLGPFRADLDMHKRLAGQDPNFKITGQRFIDDGFLPHDTPKDDADSFADAVQQMSGVAVNIATDPAPAVGSGPVAFKLDYSGGKAGFRCRPLGEAERAALFGGAPEGITSVFGDVANFFKHVWNDIEEIYVQVENAASKVAKFVMKVAGEVKSFILTTIDDIRDGLEMIFQAMAKFFDEVIDFIKKVIEWLKLLFNWKNIVRSKRVLSYLFEQNLANIRTGLGPSGALQTWINGQFATLQGSIESYFHSIESIFGPDNTFNSFVPSSAGQDNPQLSGSPPLEAAPLDTQWQANGVQNTYVLNKAIAGLPDALTEAMAEFQGDDLGQQLIDAFNNAIPTGEFEESLKTLMAFFKEVNSVDSFFNVVIYAFLVAAEDAVLLIIGLIQAFIDVLLTLAGEAVALFQAFLTRRINIPVLSSLYEVIAGDHLTMLDLGCLILAAPGTILYDILYGHAPFTDDDVKRFTSMQIVWPWDRPMAGAGSASEQSSQDEQLWATVLSFAILAGGIYGLTDVACDVGNVGQQAVSGSADGSGPLGIGNTTYSTLNLIAAFSSWVLNGPWLDSSMHETTAADKLNWSAWAMGLVPLFSDCCFMFGSPQKESTRFQPGVGPIIVTAIGLTQLAVGIAAAVEFKGNPNFNRCNQAAVVLGPVANVGKVATYIGHAGPEAVIVASVILGILDVGSDIGAAILGAITNGASSTN
ncbi:hypothetical protein [Zavarzinia sp.]|uniref:hypothetical protein n=1 Tax=Zavarzinia sp. TaxID=2027920 RepID=UPI003BB7CEC9